MVKRLKRRKKNNWFSTTFIGLILAFGLFLLGFFYATGFYSWLDTIINYGLGLSGSAVIIFGVSSIIPSMRRLIKGIF